jgi:hypothetical protein
MGTWIKKNYRLIALILALALTAWFAERLLCHKTIHGIMQAKELYAQPEDTIDVAFLGSSHVHYDVNTAKLWEDYGIAGYDYSAAEQPLWITYYYLIEMCKTQSPKLVVLDLYSPVAFFDDYQYYFLSDNLNGVKLSLNKIKMMMAAAEPEKILDHFPNFSCYHLRYSELTEDDVEYVFSTKEERQTFKGYTPHFKVADYPRPDWECDEVGVLPAKTEKYLVKIINYCKEHDIELYLVANPYYVEYQEACGYNRIKQIAEQYGVKYDDYNDYYDEMGLDFSKDLNDDSHLNYEGSCKFTALLGKNIKDSFDIPDRRGQERWESWNRHAADIARKAKARDSDDRSESSGG